MKTRDKILSTALELFNTHGITAISGRDISEAMGISYGNLTYHFPKKDDIIRQLYLNMQTELDEQFGYVEKQIFGVAFMMASLRQIFEILYKYKFIYLGITKVARHFSEIKEHAQMQFNKRREMMRKIADFLIREGYLTPEQYSGQYDFTIHNLQIILHSWIADAEIFHQGSENERVEYYLQLFYNCYRPLLSDKGRRLFEEAIQTYRQTYHNNTGFSVNSPK
ncbi:TetR/AcrR family transcriptional regulator [Eisenibacter elegans]|uniref:TetR/AcrR family transcriptional regulator n=1 Tax=Eisenibacter elegans TaxID=997 RepID=UPI00042952D3|nr:TetR/AcrR family transcriptional regulator [Eisenibacter elegans]